MVDSLHNVSSFVAPKVIEMLRNDILKIMTDVNYRAFVNTRQLVHKHVKVSVGKWILETTHPHKHVQIS